MSQIDPNILAALDWGFRIAAIVGGWFLKVLFDRLDDLRSADSTIAVKVDELADEVKKVRIELPTNYVQKAEFKDALDNIFNALRRIEDKVDHKLDMIAARDK